MILLIGIENMDDDPGLEIVYVSKAPLNPIIYIFDGESGALQWLSREWKHIKIFSKYLENPYPIINISLKDVDNDGKAELVFLGKKTNDSKIKQYILEF